MKYVIVLPDGASDDQLPELEGRTPLEAARIPNMDWVSTNGMIGRAVTVPDGLRQSARMSPGPSQAEPPRKTNPPLPVDQKQEIVFDLDDW